MSFFAVKNPADVFYPFDNDSKDGKVLLLLKPNGLKAVFVACVVGFRHDNDGILFSLHEI